MHTFPPITLAPSWHGVDRMFPLGLGLAFPLVAGSKLVRPTRFAIINPDSLSWGESDWFAPLADLTYGPDLWMRKANGLVYARCELTPSKPLHRSAERLALVRAYDADPADGSHVWSDTEGAGSYAIPSSPFWTRTHAIEAMQQARDLP